MEKKSPKNQRKCTFLHNFWHSWVKTVLDMAIKLHRLLSICPAYESIWEILLSFSLTHTIYSAICYRLAFLFSFCSSSFFSWNYITSSWWWFIINTHTHTCSHMHTRTLDLKVKSKFSNSINFHVIFKVNFFPQFIKIHFKINSNRLNSANNYEIIFIWIRNTVFS